MLVDANILIYAHDRSNPFHATARRWLLEQLRGARPVGIAWPSIVAYLRIMTTPRAVARPLSAVAAWADAESWFASPAVWSPTPGPRHRVVLGDLITQSHLTGKLVPDAHLAALAIEHGLVLCSADSDFARFASLRWRNPLSA